MVQSDSSMAKKKCEALNQLNCWLFRFSLCHTANKCAAFACAVRANKRPNLIVGNLRWWMCIVHVKFSLNNRYLPEKTEWSERLRLLTHWNEYEALSARFVRSLSILDILQIEPNTVEKIEITGLCASRCAAKTKRFSIRSEARRPSALHFVAFFRPSFHILFCNLHFGKRQHCFTIVEFKSNRMKNCVLDYITAIKCNYFVHVYRAFFTHSFVSLLLKQRTRGRGEWMKRKKNWNHAQKCK